MNLTRLLRARCRACAKDFLRGEQSCGTCQRNLEGYSLAGKQPKAPEFLTIVAGIFGMQDSDDCTREERPLSESLADWRDPMVLRIVVLVLLTVLLF